MTVNLHLVESIRPGQSELTARNLSVRFEGLSALEKIDLAVKRDEIVGLIGPNGAGKTTFVNVFTGFQSPDEGGVYLGSDGYHALATTPYPASRCDAHFSGRSAVQGSLGHR